MTTGTVTTETVTTGTVTTGTVTTETVATRAEPAPPAALDRALARAFALLGRLRRGRAVHGRGEAWHGELRVPAASRSSDVGGTERWGAPLLDEPGTHAVLVRRSRALGLPSWLPDVTGVAIRVLDAGGTGLHQDLLLDTGGRSVIGRRVPTLHLAGHEQHYSSLLTWQAGSGKVMFGARATGPSSMQLLLARSSGPWQAWATLTLTERLPRDAADALHLSPANTGAGLTPVGWLQRLRPDSYAASARGDADHV